MLVRGLKVCFDRMLLFSFGAKKIISFKALRCQDDRSTQCFHNYPQTASCHKVSHFNTRSPVSGTSLIELSSHKRALFAPHCSTARKLTWSESFIQGLMLKFCKASQAISQPAARQCLRRLGECFWSKHKVPGVWRMRVRAYVSQYPKDSHHRRRRRPTVFMYTHMCSECFPPPRKS